MFNLNKLKDCEEFKSILLRCAKKLLARARDYERRCKSGATDTEYYFDVGVTAGWYCYDTARKKNKTYPLNYYLQVMTRAMYDEFKREQRICSHEQQFKKERTDVAD